MPWNELKSRLKGLPPEALMEMLKGLYQLSPQNKAWLEARLAPASEGNAYLEECRKKVIRLVYDPRRAFPDKPHFREAKKIISEYRKAASDPAGTLDLMLTYLERGHAYTNDFGDIDMPFYDALINMLYRFAKELQKLPDWPVLYSQRFRARLQAIYRTSSIGWGYGDAVQEVFQELETNAEAG